MAGSYVVSSFFQCFFLQIGIKGFLRTSGKLIVFFSIATMQWEISSSVFTCCESVTEWMPFSFSVCSSSLVLGSFFNSEIDEKQETMHLKWFQRDSYFYSLPYCQGCPLAGNEVYQQADAWWYVIKAVSSIFCKYNDGIILKEGKIIPPRLPDSQLMSCPAVTACVWWGLLVGCCCLQEYGCWCCGTRYCGSAAVASLEFVLIVSFALRLSEYQPRSFFWFQEACVLQKAKASTLPENNRNNWCLGEKSEW